MAVGGLEEYRRLIRGTGLQLGYGRIQGQAGAQQGAVRFIQRVDLVHGDIIQVFYFRDAALGINPAQPASERQGSNEAEQHQQHSGTDFQFFQHESPRSWTRPIARREIPRPDSAMGGGCRAE